MKKRSPPLKSKITPEEALQFLEDIRQMQEQLDEPTKAISIRIPANILRALKAQAKIENKKYQSLIMQYIRQGLKP